VRRPGAAIAAGLLALGLSAGCVPDAGPFPAGAHCTDEARPDGTCEPPSRQTVQDWIDVLGVSREAVNRCLLRHPDGDAATELCVWSQAK
jgi:hypothetical protein